ncbi:IS1/IS1595 family N-terminal zinc-binding domain-containing protein [Thiothrix eikelboomii]|uniref:IS1/IS1595 family N-terminal zinc-binding domain-containing protein n=1 Tax=Thiothrix eikelboomii TaxID=92487 RepID=UPI00389AE3BF
MRFCQGEWVYRHGKARSGLQRYRCCDCHHCFQLEYRYEANKLGVTDKISEMAINGSGVRIPDGCWGSASPPSLPT